MHRQQARVISLHQAAEVVADTAPRPHAFSGTMYRARTTHHNIKAHQVSLWCHVPANLNRLPLLFVITTAVFVNTSAVAVQNALLANYSPRTWRGTAFGAKCVLSLGVSALAVPMVVLILRVHGRLFLALREFSGVWRQRGSSPHRDCSRISKRSWEWPRAARQTSSGMGMYEDFTRPAYRLTLERRAPTVSGSTAS